MWETYRDSENNVCFRTKINTMKQLTSVDAARKFAEFNKAILSAFHLQYVSVEFDYGGLLIELEKRGFVGYGWTVLALNNMAEYCMQMAKSSLFMDDAYGARKYLDRFDLVKAEIDKILIALAE